MKNKKYKASYPKAYIIAAAVFAVFFFGVWAFYGMMYTSDMQVLNHCKISILANSAEKYVSDEALPMYDSAYKAFLEITEISADSELSEEETNALERLTDCMNELKPRMDADDAYAGKAMDETNAFKRAAKNLSEASKNTAEDAVSSSKKMHIRGDYAMTAIFLVTITAILYIGHLVRKKESALATEEEANRKLKVNVEKTRDKVYEAAYKNLLLNCGNRYALQEATEEKAGKNQSYCIAQFTVVTFANLISMFGYNNMDNCLANIGKVLEKFNDVGSLYAASEGTLVFAFNEDIVQNTAMNKAEQIRSLIQSLMSSNFHIEVPVQGAILSTIRFRGKSGDAILQQLHSATIQSNANAPISLV